MPTTTATHTCRFCGSNDVEETYDHWVIDSPATGGRFESVLACPSCSYLVRGKPATEREARLAEAQAAYEAEVARRVRLAAKVPASLIEEVRAYAYAHYTEGGWDVLVECWEDADIAEAIAGATTLLGARRKLATVIGVWAARSAGF